MPNKLNLHLIRQIIFTLLSISCMILIFSFSCENGNESSNTSGNVTEFVAENLVSGYHKMTLNEKQETYSIIDHIIRKTAHFTIYMSLGFCVSCTVGKRKFLSVGSALCIGICFIYACSDELHQYFIPERSCQFTDVLIDTIGAFTGMLISLLIISLINSIIKRKSSHKKNESP